MPIRTQPYDEKGREEYERIFGDKATLCVKNVTSGDTNDTQKVDRSVYTYKQVYRKDTPPCDNEPNAYVCSIHKRTAYGKESKCCNAPVKISDPSPDFLGDDPKKMKIGTCSFICSNCQKECNIK